MRFTNEELQLIAIYKRGNRRLTIREIVNMLPYLEKDERELSDLSQSAVSKLEQITDEEFLELDLFPEDGKEPERNGEAR